MKQGAMLRSRAAVLLSLLLLRSTAPQPQHLPLLMQYIRYKNFRSLSIIVDSEAIQGIIHKQET
jgi:hypothetical protein